MLATVMLATSQCRSGWRAEQSANDRAEGPLWVKTGKARREHKMSALPLKADIRVDVTRGRLVPQADIRSKSTDYDL